MCNSKKKVEQGNRHTLSCAHFEQQTHQQNGAQIRGKKLGFHLNQRCTWVLPVDERDFYRKSRRFCCWCGNKNAASNGEQRRARKRRAADIRAAPHKYLHANRGATTSERERALGGEMEAGLMVHWWRSILKLHCDLIQCERKQCRRWIIIIMTAAACERSRVSAAMDEFIRALVSTEICSAAAPKWWWFHVKWPAMFSLCSACPEDNHCFPLGSIFQPDSAAVVAATAAPPPRVFHFRTLTKSCFKN